MLPFRDRLSVEQRSRECANVRAQHPDHIPVIFERLGREMPRIDKEKFLVPRDLTAAQVTFVLRKRLRLDANQSLFLFCSDTTCLVTGSTEIASLYESHKDPEDGFLYLSYSLENAFGI